MPTVLLADPDPARCEMFRDALLEGSGPIDLRRVSDGQEMLDYLHRRGAHEDATTSPRPAIMLVDVDLEGPAGAGAVRAVKDDPDLRRIPLIALTSRADPEAIRAAYDAGANTVLAKPVTFLALVKLMKVFTAYWLEAAELPPEPA
jgi:two-component system response regulator